TSPSSSPRAALMSIRYHHPRSIRLSTHSRSNGVPCSKHSKQASRNDGSQVARSNEVTTKERCWPSASISALQRYVGVNRECLVQAQNDDDDPSATFGETI